MKNTKVLAIGLLMASNLFFTSCKKDYTCVCDYAYYGIDGNIESGSKSNTITAKSKAEAQNQCNEGDSQSGDPEVFDCGLQ